MPAIAKLFAIGVALAISATALAQATADYSAEGTSQCLSCHDFGPEAPVHAVMEGSHGDTGNPEEMIGRKGCEDCHGASASHTASPTQVSPGVSFGPRWTATSADQDSQCLACHEENVAQHWQDALHMHNNLTCVTCHDIHVEEDKVLFAKQQAEVCTVCHKAQKQGIHGMQRRASRNPPCTECHNPHDHESAQDEMLRNHSAGCSQCHDLVRMAGSDRVSDKAKSYHKVMARPGSTCLQCHEGIAHAPADSVPPMHPTPKTARTVTLFYPGVADSDWLLQAHPGSQPLRQGTNCQRCHRGDEATMGASGSMEPASRDIQVAFRQDGEDLLINLAWDGPENESALSIMWGGRDNEAFRRGGCFAACHSDMPGMTKDRGQQTGKYLSVSRAQQQRIGQPAIVRSSDELEQLLAQGQFAELWRIQLQSGSVERSLLLADSQWQPTKLISINKSYHEGRWTVELRHIMNDTGSGVGVSFVTQDEYTFGIALNGADNPAGEHWVSLPMTLSLGGDGTDFTAE